MTEPELRVTRDEGIATITLNRPGKLNSLTAGMLEALLAALAEAEADASVRVVILTGAGRGFCAGQDLNERASNPADTRLDLGQSIERRYNPLVRFLRDMEKPVIGAVNGVAAGAGANLALACDIVIAARSAKFIQAFCRIGLIPDSGGTFTLPRLVGRARAAGLMLLGEDLPAERAAEWGLIWKCVADETLEEEALSIARRLAGLPATGLALIKRALVASFENGFDAQLDLERDLQHIAGESEEYRERVAAFLNKRAPRET
jgi:2-(1,2-epoxy-1,2-dihydrophenyl)acetyl-CoA isomerase